MTTQHTPEEPVTIPTPAETRPAKRRWSTKRIVGTSVAGVLATIVAISVIGALTPDKQQVVAPQARASTSAPVQAAAPVEVSTPADTPVAVDTPAAPATPDISVSRQQALESAQSYLDLGSGFSRAGLIRQLHSQAGEGFPLGDATWAVDNVGANWKEQAVLSARGYLDLSGFSRSGLIEQLTSPYGEQFTYSQAIYAVNKVGL